jgi:Family of unknown function (DUF5372)
VTYPFHPWVGREFVFVAVRQTWGKNRVFFFDEDGVQRSLPRGGPPLRSDPMLHWPADLLPDRPHRALKRPPDHQPRALVLQVPREHIYAGRRSWRRLALMSSESDQRSDLLERFAGVLSVAAGEVEARMLKRGGKSVREEDLRGGLAQALRENHELVLTEARLAVPGWTENLGGFDLAIVDHNNVALAETKWSDGNLYEAMWDVLKLASATTHPAPRQRSRSMPLPSSSGSEPTSAHNCLRSGACRAMT